jgi:asparagine N-glycosylation enzyme membrane subunit Stt3
MGKLGFTDHHVLEGLTAACLLWALVRWRPWWAGAALGAYLLTWVGGALVAALVVAWMALELILDHSRFRASIATLALALACVVPFFDSLWMEYSLAVLVSGLVMLSLIRVAGWRWTLGVVAAGAGIAVWLKPELAGILAFITSPSNSTGVAELRPLVYRSGRWTLVPYFQQLGVVGLLMIPALGLLARRLVGSTGSGFRLLWAWAIVFLVLAAGQERLAQYLLLGAIPLGAGLVAWLVDRLRPALRPFAVTVAALLLVGPSAVFYPQLLGPDSGVPAAWREALAWVRTQTPDPAAQPYGILNWWGSGYWITALAHRQPLSNPTQTGAEEAARLLLSEDPAIAATMAKQGLWYAVVSSELLLLPSAQGASGAFTSVVGGAGQNISNYIQTFYRAGPDGSLNPEVRFMPAYFRTLIARLGLSGPWRHAGSASVQALAYVRKQRQGQSYKEIVAEFAGTPEQADLFIAQQQALGNDASRVSDNPAVPCIPVELPAGIRQVFPEASRLAPETLVFAIAR